MSDTKDSTTNTSEPKKNIFGFRKKEKIKLPQIIARALEIPENKVSVIDPTQYTGPTLPVSDQNITKFDKDAHSKLMETDKNNISSENSVTPQSTTENNQSEDTTEKQTSSKSKIPIVSNFEFDSSVKENDQNTIKNVMMNLNTILRLPELGMFADDELEGKTDSVILVEKLIDDDGEKQNTPKEIYIEPFIQMTEE